MIILASNSPRRRELLGLITNEFKVVPANVDETVNEQIELTEHPLFLAHKKARFVADNMSANDIVIGCDTAVFTENKMLGKPKTEQEAYNMLKMLSGKRHYVITGVSILKGDKEINFSEKTIVEFHKLNDNEIYEYIKTGEPMDKAGAYGIQGKGALFVKQIEGDFYNVVGLPVSRLKREISSLLPNSSETPKITSL